MNKGVSLLQLSDISALGIDHLFRLFEYQKTNGLKVDALLVAGAGTDGSHMELKKASWRTEQFADLLGLPKDHLLAVPNPTDVLQGFDHYNQHFHTPLCGQPFDVKNGHLLHLSAHCQIMALNTVKGEFGIGFRKGYFARIHERALKENGSPQTIRICLHYHPLAAFDPMDEAPGPLIQERAARGQLHLGFVGMSESLTRTGYLEFGTPRAKARHLTLHGDGGIYYRVCLLNANQNGWVTLKHHQETLPGGRHPTREEPVA